MIKINALGDTCPIPVVKTKNAIKEMKQAGEIEILVDNEIAVQNITKMAKQKGYGITYEKLEEQKFKILLTIREENIEDAAMSMIKIQKSSGNDEPKIGTSKYGTSKADTSKHGTTNGGALGDDVSENKMVCEPDTKKKTVIVISSGYMGNGSEELGTALLKGFIYAITKQDILPATMLFYNGGAKLTCEGSDSLEDLTYLSSQGVEILTCGTCLNYYELTDKLTVGSVTNMYAIAEIMMQADLIVKPC